MVLLLSIILLNWVLRNHWGSGLTNLCRICNCDLVRATSVMRNSHVICKNHKVLYVLLLNILRVLCDCFCKATPLLPAVEGLFRAPDDFGIG
jgi:hypothetical protein